MCECVKLQLQCAVRVVCCMYVFIIDFVCIVILLNDEAKK
jgi:hypothetical protein